MLGGGRFPFTASQWQELQHQALIFKYMVSGTPVPDDLILPIRRSLSFYSDPILLFHHQPNLGWGNFHMGLGKKADDAEPWRCRRTDGKKWRCSKEAFPESKYCERHMHRGKNRSRKPVENPNSHLVMVKPFQDGHGHGHGNKMRESSWSFTQLGLSFNGGSSFLREDDGEREKRRECFLMGKDMRAEKGKDGIFPMTQLSISMARSDKGSWVDGSLSSAGF